jgi:hypothetical protein
MSPSLQMLKAKLLRLYPNKSVGLLGKVRHISSATFHTKWKRLALGSVSQQNQNCLKAGLKFMATREISDTA